MILPILDTTTTTIIIKMSGAAATTNPDWTSSFADHDGTSFTEGSENGALNGTSDVTVVSAPGASTRRTIKSITVANRDTAAVTITVIYDDNTTQREVATVTLQVDDTWTLDGSYDSSGAFKQTFSGAILQDGSVAMTGDFNLDGNNIDNGGVIFLKEQAEADGDVAGSGQIWVDTATPNKLMFTDDAGTDFILNDTTDNLRFIEIEIVGPGTDVATGTDLEYWDCPFSGTIVQDDSNPYWFCAYNETAGTTGTMVVDIHLNGTTIMSTNKLDIESGEDTSATATTQPDLTTTAITAGDRLTYEVDAIHTTAAQGLKVRIPIRPN